MAEPEFTVRIATSEDGAAVSQVLAASYGSLLAAHYDAALLERALPLMSRANRVLLGSGKYYVAETSEAEIIGCGGWSFERPGTTNVVPGTAHVRHFATDPRWIGRGVAKAILSRCLRAGATQGVQTMEAYSTLAAVGFYRALGFIVVAKIDVALRPGVILPSIHMRRETRSRPSTFRFPAACCSNTCCASGTARCTLLARPRSLRRCSDPSAL